MCYQFILFLYPVIEWRGSECIMTFMTFSGIKKIEYNPDAGPVETMVFKHYNAKEVIYITCLSKNDVMWYGKLWCLKLFCWIATFQVIMGKTMEDWLRFSVVYWHTFRGTGTRHLGITQCCGYVEVNFVLLVMCVSSYWKCAFLSLAENWGLNFRLVALCMTRRVVCIVRDSINTVCKRVICTTCQVSIHSVLQPWSDHGMTGRSRWTTQSDDYALLLSSCRSSGSNTGLITIGASFKNETLLTKICSRNG